MEGISVSGEILSLPISLPLLPCAFGGLSPGSSLLGISLDLGTEGNAATLPTLLTHAGFHVSSKQLPAFIVTTAQ